MDFKKTRFFQIASPMVGLVSSAFWICLVGFMWCLDLVGVIDYCNTDLWKYEKCCLMIVNLDSQKPFFYNNSYELKHDKIVSEYFALEYADIGFDLFVSDLLKIYRNRFSTKYGSR